jgi:PBSX family phage terminase large subunit
MDIDLGIPNKKQDLFLKDHHRHVAFGGARGGGKSWAVRAKAILLATNNPGIKIMIIRRTYPELEQNHIRPLKKLLHVGTPGCLIRYNEAKKTMTFPNESTILFGYCKTDADTDRYQGTEVDVLFLDEATQLTEQQIKDLNSCVRGPNDFPKRTYYTCNPGGRGHGYIKRLFVTREYMANERPENYSFIQSLVYDNDVLMQCDPEYVQALEVLPEAKRKAWLEGDWDSFIGQVFNEWRNDASHYQDRLWTHVIDDFEIPADWKIYRGYDHGYSKPFSVGWFAVDHDGRIYRIAEWYGCTAEPNTGLQLTVQEIAEGIKERERTLPNLKGRKVYGIADPAIWGSQSGESIEEMFEKCGVYNSKGDHTRLAGIMQFHYRLSFNEYGVPMFYCFKSCKQFIRCIPLLIYDEKHVEDIDTELEDHNYDEARYVFMEHPLNPKKLKKIYTNEDPLPPMDPLNLITPERRRN